MLKFLGFTLAEGATHVAHCNDVHSYLRHWCKAFTHVALCNDVHSYLRHWYKTFTHVGHCNNKRLFGFTLAEVLITLGIIGVVAALTLPSVIQNYQKKVTVERLKKSYSTLAQAVQMSVKDNDEIETWDFSLSAQEFMDKYITPYIKDISTRAKNNGVDNNSKEYIFADGTTIYAWTLNSTLQQCIFIRLQVDINGDARPNIIGKDIFVFYIFPKANGFYNGGVGDIAVSISKGGLYPDGYGYSRDTLLNNSWRGCNKRGGKAVDSSGVERNNAGGAFCIALIMYDGWQIKEDYNW